MSYHIYSAVKQSRQPSAMHYGWIRKAVGRGAIVLITAVFGLLTGQYAHQLYLVYFQPEVVDTQELPYHVLPQRDFFKKQPLPVEIESETSQEEAIEENQLVAEEPSMAPGPTDEATEVLRERVKMALSEMEKNTIQ